MITPLRVAVVAALVFPHSAIAATLGPVESQVYEVAGTPAELARKAVVCIGQTVRSGYTTAPVIIAQDIEGGRVVAQSAFGFTTAYAIPERGRATITFEAKPGRFRIVHSDIERLSYSSWVPVSKPKTTRKASIDTVLGEITEAIASCVKAPPADW